MGHVDPVYMKNRYMQYCTTGQFYASSPTLIKKKIKFSSYIRKSRVEQLQSHI
jgi:hypothetical protein